MGAIGYGNRGHAGSGSHFKIMGRITDHQCRLRRRSQRIHHRLQHAGMRLRKPLVGAARGIETAREPGLHQRAIQTAPALAGSHRQQEAAVTQFANHLRRSRKQGRAAVTQQKMAAIEFKQPRILLRQQVGHGVGQRIRQAEADHVTRLPLPGHRNPEFGTGRLQRLGDGCRRIHQCPVPVENQQFKPVSHVAPA